MVQYGIVVCMCVLICIYRYVFNHRKLFADRKWKQMNSVVTESYPRYCWWYPPGLASWQTGLGQPMLAVRDTAGAFPSTISERILTDLPMASLHNQIAFATSLPHGCLPKTAWIMAPCWGWHRCRCTTRHPVHLADASQIFLCPGDAQQARFGVPGRW